MISHQNARFSHDYFNDRVESARVKGNCRWLMYQHFDFNLVDGYTYLIKHKNYDHFSEWGGKGNQLSSARALPPDGTEAIVLFQLTHFRGRMVVLFNSESHLPSIEFNDKLSSYIVIGGRWALYQYVGYTGKTITVRGPREYPKPPFSIGNNQISSVRKL